MKEETKKECEKLLRESSELAGSIHSLSSLIVKSSKRNSDIKLSKKDIINFSDSNLEYITFLQNRLSGLRILINEL